MNVERIAVLMTCYNRKEKTVECLTRLKLQKGLGKYKTQIFLVDDGSQDGTGEEVRKQFPEVRILQGDGTLFWCGGMRFAFGEALKEGFDFYLWLNDDTMLYDFALHRMLNTYNNLSDIGIIVGSLCDPENQKLTYGGSRTIGRKWFSNRYEMVQPNQVPQRCDLFHGNCILLPKMVATVTGNLSRAYKHGAGDIDYALRAAKFGFTSWICPGYVGSCSKNKHVEPWKNRALSLNERIEAIHHPVIIARIEDWIVYTKKHHKLLWPLFYAQSFIIYRFPKLYFLLESFFSR
jgi:GT2 family glycosyltransferase